MSDESTAPAPAAAPETPAPSAQTPAEAPKTAPATEPSAPAPKAAAEAPKAPSANPYAGAKPKPAAPPAPDADTLARIAALEAQSAAAAQALRGHAEDALAQVPEAAQKAVRTIAGEDPAALLSALRALRTNGLIAPPIPAGATTAPAVAAPSAPNEADADAQLLKTFRDLERSAPVIAHTFRRANEKQIERALARSKPSN